MIHNSVKIFPGAQVVGNINIGEWSSVWYNAVIRGDIEPISIGNSSNIQDNCVLHSSSGYPLKIGDFVSVGHAAVLHGCKINNNCLVGMNATLLNSSQIKENSIVGAGAVVTEGKVFPPKSLIMGIPARKMRDLNPEEIENIKNNSLRYLELAKSPIKGADDNKD